MDELEAKVAKLQREFEQQAEDLEVAVDELADLDARAERAELKGASRILILVE